MITPGHESYLSKMVDVEDIGVHLFIAARVPAVAAARANDHRTRDSQRSAIEIDRTALNVEASIHVVRVSAQREGDFACIWIDSECLMLSRRN